MIKHVLLLCAAATFAGALPVPASAEVNFSIGIDVAPPPRRVEVIPPPREGFVWAPGYWNWDGGNHVWVGGRWIAARPGYYYVPERWEEHAEARGHHWHFQPGHWEREHGRWEHDRGHGDRDRR